MAHACNSNTREAGTGESQTLANSVSHDQILSACSPSMGRCSQGDLELKVMLNYTVKIKPASDTRQSQNK